MSRKCDFCGGEATLRWVDWSLCSDCWGEFVEGYGEHKEEWERLKAEGKLIKKGGD